MTVNGKTVTELGTKADLAADDIRVDGKPLRREPHAYFVLNKPRNVLCAVSDPTGRAVVSDFIRSKLRLYPVGRLDFDSEGLVLMSNDGDLTKAVTDGGKVPKVYRVKVTGRPPREVMDLMRKGLRLKDGTELAPCKIKVLKVEQNSWFEIVLKQGKNRQIHRMFDHFQYEVMRLRRIAIGPVQLGDLKPGESRKLTEREVTLLKEWAGLEA